MSDLTPPLTPSEAAVLALLRDAGPQKLSMLNELAIDTAFKRKPKLVRINAGGSANPVMDITTEGMIALAGYEREHLIES